MTNFEYVQATIDLFEDSLSTDAPLDSLGALAAKIGYSAQYLGRLFHSTCGMPLGHYMYRRRLAAAAELIRDGGFSACEASTRLGWEDYSTFSRACRKEFGVPPSALKGARVLALAERARPRRPDSAGSVRPSIRIEPARHVTGPAFYMGPNERTFHRPWRVFSSLSARIKGRTGGDGYQYSAWDESPEPEPGLWIHCAVQTDPDAPQEPVFFSRTVPAVRALIFVHEGPVEMLYQSYAAIWEDYLPSSDYKPLGAWEYQRYPGGDPDRVEICIPIA